MRKKLSTLFHIILGNWDTLLCFEVLYRIIGWNLLFPLIQIQLDAIPGRLGIPQLGQQPILLILMSPQTLLLLVGLLYLFSFYLLFELTALFVYCEKGWNRERLQPLELWKESFFQFFNLFHPTRIRAVFWLSLPLLFSIFSLVSGWLPAVRVPEMILVNIQNTPPLVIFYGGLLFLSNWILFRYLFGLPEMMIHHTSFHNSWKKSRSLLRGKGFVTFVRLLLVAGFFAVMLVLAAAGIILLFAGYTKSFATPERGRALFQICFIIMSRVGPVVAGAMAAVLLCAVIICLFHFYCGEIRPVYVTAEDGNRKFVVGRKGMVCVLVTIACLLMVKQAELGGHIILEHAPQVVAHRAGGQLAPENTIAALEQAIADHANQAEIDVQQLGDGTLVVLHDTNFRRTAGVNLNVWDACRADIQKMDAGSRFSSVYVGEPVPTLEEMLFAAKGRITLMIELKCNVHEKELERAVLKLIATNRMEAQCCIASMDLEILSRVKTQRPDIRTVFITSHLPDNCYDLPYVDGFSIETSSLTMGTAVQVQERGKLLYGWTANSTKSLDKLLYCQVDGLVTDNVPLAKYCVETNGRNQLLDTLMEWLFASA